MLGGRKEEWQKGKKTVGPQRSDEGEEGGGRQGSRERRTKARTMIRSEGLLLREGQVEDLLPDGELLVDSLLADALQVGKNNTVSRRASDHRQGEEVDTHEVYDVEEADVMNSLLLEIRARVDVS